VRIKLKARERNREIVERYFLRWISKEKFQWVEMALPIPNTSQWRARIESWKGRASGKFLEERRKDS
jgi:hypothetical protein